MQPDERSSYLAAEARRHDPDRYLCALFAPAERRDAALALVLFHHELARVPDVVSQPMAGYIRYQWWRDAIEEVVAGKPARQHPVATVLAEMLQHGWVGEGPLQALIDAREQALDRVGSEDLDGLERYVASTSGALQTLLYNVFGGSRPDEASAAQDVGTAFGLVGIIRAVAQEARRNRQPLPTSLLAAAGVSQGELAQARMSEGVASVVAAILERVEALLRTGRSRAGRPPRALMAAFLPAALTGSYVAQIRRLGGDPFRAGDLARPAAAPLQLLARTLMHRP